MQEIMSIKLFTLKQIAAAYQHPLTTTHNHITKLMLLRKFRKSSIQPSFTEKEVKQLEKLLDFKMKK